MHLKTGTLNLNQNRKDFSFFFKRKRFLKVIEKFGESSKRWRFKSPGKMFMKL
jgi:hypothetical protein